MSTIIRKKVFAIFFTISLSSIGLFNLNPVQAAPKNYKTKYNVSINKVWKINFSKEVDETSIKDNIKVLDSLGQEVPINISLDVDKRCVKVALKNGTYNGIHYNGKYSKDQKYTLLVSNGLMSKANKNEKPKKLYSEVKMDFKTEGNNPYPGLPIEDGIVVIGDKAYSVGYLSTHSNLANEIFAGGNYVVSYVSEEYGEKIKQILGDNKSKGNVEKSKEITYYSSDGNQYKYEYNDSVGEYRLLLPRIYVDVVPGSAKGVISLSVKDIKAVPGAKYFKVGNSNTIKKIGDTIIYTITNPLEKITILSSDETPLANALVEVGLPNSTYYSVNTLNKTLGNTSGNISNNGCAAIDSNLYVYYVNTADKSSLYRKDLSGKMDFQIGLDKPQYINIMGDWIYYSNYNENGKIYKVKKDGTQNQKLCDDTATYLTVCNNVIYYSNGSDKGKLYKINTDGTMDGSTINKDPSGKVHGVPVVSDYGNYNKAYDEAHFINVVGDWIYYSNFSDGHKIYAVNKDGTMRRKVNEEWSDAIQIVDGWAYYCSGEGIIKKVRTDGSSNIIPIKGTTRKVDKAYHLNIVDNWIYYSNAEDNGKLYKISINGTGEKKKLCDVKADYINIVGDIIYITSGSRTYTLPLNKEGVSPELVTKTVMDNNISKSDDLDITVDYKDSDKTLTQIEAKYLPGKVAVFMKDDTVQQLTVDWDIKNKKSNGQGIYTYQGTVLGYGKKIKCTLTIPSEMLNANSIIEVYNNGPKNGSVIVRERNFGNSPKDLEDKAKLKGAKRVEIGDIIKVYGSPKAGEKPLGQVTVNANNANSPLVKGLDLDMYGRSFWITITRKNKAESKATEVRQLGSAVITGDVLDPDGKALGVDGRDFEIRGWNNPSIRNDGFISDTTEISSKILKKIYIVPGNGKVNMENMGVKPVGTTKGNYWTGTNARDLLTGYDLLMTDSLGNRLKEGNYSLFVVTAYEGKAEEDITNYGSPLVEGLTASIPKNMKATEEKLPRQPSVSKQYVKSGDGIKIQQLQPGEEAFIAPETCSYISYDLDNREYKSHDNVFFKGETRDNSNSGRPYIEQGFQEGLRDGNIVPRTVKNGRYKVYIVNDIGGSKESSGEIIVDNIKPVVTIQNVVTNIKEVPVKGPDGTPTGAIDRVEDSITISGEAKDNEDRITTYIVPAGTAAQENIIKSSAIQKSGNRFNFNIKITDTNKDQKEKYYTVYAIDEAGNISNFKELDRAKSIFASSTMSVNMDTIQLGKDIVRSKLEGRIKYQPRDLSAIGGYYEITVEGKKYRLDNDTLRKLGTPSIDNFISSLSQAKEMISVGTEWKPKPNGSILKDMVSIYKVNDRVCIEKPDDKEIKVEDKTSGELISSMLGLNKIATATGEAAKSQKYQINVSGAQVDKECNLGVCLAGEYFEIKLAVGDRPNDVAKKISEKIRVPGYKIEYRSNTILLTRDQVGAVIPEFKITTFDY
ncbi:DUF5050 domain-containing protein [Clostridium niameyense]|uniref:DUF5050 domain-containing protein n=1 Tax=Clostridium niameyense TaxID=1622073 RepID=UPI000ABAFF20|nr:DUF5050 domain-containing protein [Clostridium niameyense]